MEQELAGLALRLVPLNSLSEERWFDNSLDYDNPTQNFNKNQKKINKYLRFVQQIDLLQIG